jgi:hypothetical protein
VIAKDATGPVRLAAVGGLKHDGHDGVAEVPGTRAALVAGTSHGVNISHVESVEGDEDTNRGGPSRPGAYQWTELMRRTLALDVLACPRCGGRLRLVALIEQAGVVQRILRHLGLPTEVPESGPARAPPRRLDEALEDQSQDAPEFDAAW